MEREVKAKKRLANPCAVIARGEGKTMEVEVTEGLRLDYGKASGARPMEKKWALHFLRGFFV